MSRPQRPNETRSLDRALLLARLLASNIRLGWRISDLARAAALELSTTHRLLRGLIDARMAFRIPGTHRYTLGPLAFELGLATRVHHDLERPMGSALEAVARRLGGTVYVMAWSGADTVCVARQDGMAAPPGLMLELGGRRPLMQTAGGLAILLELPEDERTRLLAINRKTLDTRDRALMAGIERMIKRSERAGHAVNLGDVVSGINATAVAVAQAPARLLGSVVFAQAGPPWANPQIEEIRDALQALAPALLETWRGLRY